MSASTARLLQAARFAPARVPGWLLLACLVVSGMASIRAGQDASWDLLNYHLYNAWAWINGRHGFDIAPAQAQSFHNPLADLPLQAMIDADWPPRLIAFAMGLPTGLSAFFLIVIADALFRGEKLPVRVAFVTMALAIGMSGANARGLIGTASGDWVSCAFILAGLALVVRELRPGPLRKRTLAAAGACAGFACALKLTVAPFALAMALALLARRDVRGALRDLIVFGLAAGLTLGILSAPWMLLMQQHYASPLFPYFNSLFGSPLVEQGMLLDRRFGPTSLTGWLRFPLDLAWPPILLVSELQHRDARISLALAAIVVCACVALLRRRGFMREHPASGTAFRYLAVFFLLGFLGWAGLYAIYRYTLPLETTAGVIVIAAIAAVRPTVVAVPAAALATVAIVMTTQPSNWGRVPYGSHFHQLDTPHLDAGAMVVLTTPEPMSFVLSRLDPSARHIGIHNNLVDPKQPNGLQRRGAEAVRSHPGPLYQLTPQAAPAEDTLAAFGLARVPAGCTKIASNLANMPLELCRLQRSGKPGR